MVVLSVKGNLINKAIYGVKISLGTNGYSEQILYSSDKPYEMTENWRKGRKMH